MWISKLALVFSEVIRLNHFSNIMEKGACPTKCWVRTYAHSRILCKISNHQAMMISSRSFNLHSAEQRMIKISQFEQCGICSDLEHIFNNRQSTKYQGTRQHPDHQRCNRMIRKGYCATLHSHANSKCKKSSGQPCHCPSLKYTTPQTNIPTKIYPN